MEPLVTDELWDALAPLLPEHLPSPKGGRRRVPDRRCLNGIVLVLREGLRWQSLPTELGWGSGSTCYRRFAAWTSAGVWEAAHVSLVTTLGQRGWLHLERAGVDSSSLRALRGGNHTGPNPTDRAKKGCKRHLITDANGIPLVVQTGPANRRDEQWLPCLLWWLWIVLRYGRQRRPRALQGDRGYGFPWSVALVLAWASARCWQSGAARMVAAWGGRGSWWNGPIAGSVTTGVSCCATRTRGRTTKGFTSWRPVPSVPTVSDKPIRPPPTGSPSHRPPRV